LSRRGEEVHAIEISEAGEGRRIGVGGEPLTCVAALEAGGGEGRAAEEIAGQSGFAAAVLAFNGGNLKMRRGHFGLHEELAPRGADSDEVDARG